MISYLPGERDRALTHGGHESPGLVPDLLAGPGSRDELHHGGVVGRVAGVRHDELGLVDQAVGDLARN